MRTLPTLTITISLAFLSCNNRTETAAKNENARMDTTSVDTTLGTRQQVAVIISDTIQRFVVDDYPVTNDMLSNEARNDFTYKKQSRETYSYGKVWFSNDTIRQTIAFELYTDKHRSVIYHFYNDDIPAELIQRMELHTDGGNVASEKQKQQDFGGFLKHTTKINSSYFITDKGFTLGDSKQKAIDTYGEADNYSTNDGIEKLEWEFMGDIVYDGKSDLKGKPLAEESFGHRVVMYFRKGKLIGQILQNDVP